MLKSHGAKVLVDRLNFEPKLPIYGTGTNSLSSKKTVLLQCSSYVRVLLSRRIRSIKIRPLRRLAVAFCALSLLVLAVTFWFSIWTTMMVPLPLPPTERIPENPSSSFEDLSLSYATTGKLFTGDVVRHFSGQLMFQNDHSVRCSKSSVLPQFLMTCLFSICLVLINLGYYRYINEGRELC